MTRLLPIFTASTAILWAIPAAAQITADDVRSNSNALYAAYGATQSATLTRDGSVVRVGSDTIIWDLPMDLGQLSGVMSDYTLTENADGTVTITYPAGFSVALSGRINGEGEGSIVMETGPDEITTTATGIPGSITYVTRTDDVTVTLRDANVPGEHDLAVNLTFTAESSETLTRVIEDSLTVVFTQTDVGEAVTAMNVTSSDAFSTTSNASYGPTTSIINMGLIPGGADLLNLSTALRSGMYINASSTSTRSETYSESYYFGELSDRQTVSTGAGEASFSFDRDGLGVSATGYDLVANFEQPAFLPYGAGLDLAEFSGSFQMPLIADTAAQDFGYALKIGGLRLGPTIWNLFDTDKQLDRSPLDFGIALSGSLINKIDWLDVLSLEGLNFDTEMPVDVTSISITDLTLAGLGARLTGQGAFTFDAGDTFTYPGVPRPTGEAAIEASGVNGVIDALAEIGVLPSDALFGFRMGLGMVTVPGDAPGTLSSRIEMTQDGKIFANGQQLR